MLSGIFASLRFACAVAEPGNPCLKQAYANYNFFFAFVYLFLKYKLC